MSLLFGCRMWLGAKSKRGYGQKRVKGKLLYVHRMVWKEHKGPIPEGMNVCHRCDVRACCEITHLFLGTPKQNTADMIAKGRQAPAQRGEASPLAKLTTSQVITARSLRQGGASVNDLAAQFSMSPSNMSRVLRGLRHGND